METVPVLPSVAESDAIYNAHICALSNHFKHFIKQALALCSTNRCNPYDYKHLRQVDYVHFLGTPLDVRIVFLTE